MKKSLIILFALVGMLSVSAQQISIPWHCGFEDEAENAQWKFVNPVDPEPVDTLLVDAWAIGRGARSEGKQSMYISVDSGLTATFGSRPDVTIAYRLIQFPVLTEKKEYDLSFDFSTQGPMTGKLYVFFDYASKLITGTDQYQLLQYANVGNTTIPNTVLEKARYVYTTGYSRTNVLRNQKTWLNVSVDAGSGTNYSERVKAGETGVYALVFMWVNQNTQPSAQSKGACVDNIQIASASLQKPQNLVCTTACEDSSITISWDGVLSDYVIKYKKSSAAAWRKMTYYGQDGQTHHSRTIPALRDGTYDFCIVGTRTMWDESLGRTVTDSSAQASISSVLLYCPENQCINFIDLDAADCSYGENGHISDASAVHEKIDFGPEDVLSFHTVITDPNLYDIRTNYKVKEIPEGALASIRLGNWYSPGDNSRLNPKVHMDDPSKSVNGQAITYTYRVDTTKSAILVLQYAIVFEQTNHDRKDQPYFKLTILDEDGTQIDDICGTRKFDCPFASDEESPEEQKRRVDEEHWKFYPKEDQPARNNDLGFKGDTIWYKDWTSMGLNLTNYHNHNLKVNIESRGCGMSAHYGYGYFTLSCASATLETDQCGSQAEATVDAPEGFNYQWYAEKDSAKFNKGGLVQKSVVVSTERSFTAPLGTDQVYVCHLSYIDAEDCGFDLKTTLSPRDVQPGFDYSLAWNAERWGKCKTGVILNDTSHVIRYQADGSIAISAEKPDYSNWVIRSLTKKDQPAEENSGDRVEYVVSELGDTIEVTQTAFIGECFNVFKDTIVAPYILTPDSVVHDSVCSNHKYVFDGHVFDGRYFPKRDTFYTATYRNQYGCDSTLSLYLRVDSATVYEIHDTVSRNDLPLIFNVLYKGETIRHYEVGNYYDSVTSDFYVLKLVNRFDCDSMVNLKLTIIPKLKVQVGETGDLCGSETFDLSYRITEGDYDSLLISFSEAARRFGLRDTTLYHDPYGHPLSPWQEWSMPFDIPEGITPNHYYANMTFYQHTKLFQPQTHRVNIEIKYDTTVIRQKWNDVLSLLNQDYNGGYTFTSYQWYENDTPLEGQTKSYLYLPSGLNLTGTSYKALITRNDGVQQFTCNFYPTDRSGQQISDYPSVMQVGERVSIRTSGRAQVGFRSMMGMTYSTTTVSGQQSTIVAPNTPGWYVLQVQLEEGELHSQRILVVQQ